MTRLHKAATEGNLADLISYLESGDNISGLNGDGATPLHVAAEKGHFEVVMALIELGAYVYKVKKIKKHLCLLRLKKAIKRLLNYL